MDDSHAEQIQRAHPALRVVKSLNTMNCDVMVARTPCRVSTTSSWPGTTPPRRVTSGPSWSPSAGRTGSIRDLGGLEAARGLEMYLLFWISLRMTLGHNAFNIRVVT